MEVTIEKLRQQAMLISKSKRMVIIKDIPEVKLHRELERLFQRMMPQTNIEVTHGNNEFGRDLVIIESTQLGGERCIAAIVKAGDISGKSSGKIDEIVSQHNQCFSHPVKLKTRIDEIPVHEVLIIISGDLTPNARERLLSELKINKSHTDIITSGKLSDWFTEYYPEVYFDGELMDYLGRKIEIISKDTLFHTSEKSITERFVDPFIQPIDTPAEISGETIKVVIRKGKLPFERIGDILQDNREIIIAGEPGTGKSLALAKFTIDMYRNAINSSIKRVKQLSIPIFIRALDLTKITQSEDLIKDIPVEIKDRFLIDILIVDGLDEVIPSERENVIKKSQKLAKELKGKLIISSRKIDIIKDEIITSGFQKYELLPFEFGQAIQLFEKNVSSDELLNTLKEGLSKLNFHVPMTPMSLMLLIKLVEAYREIPATISELYDRFSDLTLGRFDRSKGIDVLFEYLIKKRFLAKLAYECFFQTNSIQISREQFDVFYDNYVKEFGFIGNQMESFLFEIDRSGLIDIGKHEVLFRHRSFLDFYSSFYIFENREEIESLDDLLLSLYFNDFWEDLAFFYFGLKREINMEMINKILTHENGKTTNIQKFMIGKILQAAWYSKEKVKKHGLRESVKYATIVRKDILEMIDRDGAKIPRILADFAVMLMSIKSFDSFILHNLIKTLYLEMYQNPNNENIYPMWIFLSSFLRILPKEEKKEFLINYIELINADLIEDDEKRARLLILTQIIAEDDKEIQRVLKRKLNRLISRNKSMFKALLPPPPPPRKKKRRIR